jgi:hypothetical protein
MTERRDDLLYDDALPTEAKADSAPVTTELSYKPRSAWKPGRCVGYIINWSTPVAKMKWPKKKDAKAFFERINRAANLQQDCHADD